jgi:hypothetical protein
MFEYGKTYKSATNAIFYISVIYINNVIILISNLKNISGEEI